MATHSMKQILQSVQGKIRFQQLEQREKIVLCIGMAFLLCFFLVQFVVFPYLDTRKRLTRSLADKKSNLTKILKMQKEYLHLKNAAGETNNKLSERAPGFTLFSFIEEQATTAKVKQQIQYMKPSTSDKEGVGQESAVEMKLQRVTLEQLVGFLKLLESPENLVFIRHISIQESGANESLLDVILQVFTPVNTS